MGMVQFVHPQREDITLAGVLAALADPMRLRIVKSLMEEKDCMSCTAAAPCGSLNRGYQVAAPGDRASAGIGMCKPFLRLEYKGGLAHGHAGSRGPHDQI